MQFGAGGGERGIARRRRAVDDEVCARQCLEHGVERRIGDPVMRPGEPARAATSGMASSIVRSSKRGAEFAARIGRRHRVIGQPEAAAGEIGLAVARRVEVLRLQRGVRRDARSTAARVAIAGLDARGVTLAVEIRVKLIADGAMRLVVIQ